MIVYALTVYMVSLENIFFLILQNTSLYYYYGYGKKEKKYEVLYTLANKAIPSCEIWNNDKNLPET